MPRLSIPDEQTFAQFTVTTPTAVFPITFRLVSGKPDLVVLVDGEALDGSAYGFTGTKLEGGGYAGGTVTLNTAVDDVALRIERNVSPTRTSQFAPSNSVPVGVVDMALNRIVASQQDLDRRKVTRPPGDRAGLYLAFDADGNETSSSGTGTDAGLRADLAADEGGSLVGFTQDGDGAISMPAIVKWRSHLSIDDFIPQEELPWIRSLESDYDISAEAWDNAIGEAMAGRKGLALGGGKYRALNDLNAVIGYEEAIDIVGVGDTRTFVEFWGTAATNGLYLHGPEGMESFEYGPSVRHLELIGGNGAPRGLTANNLSRLHIDRVSAGQFAGCGFKLVTTIMTKMDHVLANGCGSLTEGAIEVDGGTTLMMLHPYISGGLLNGAGGKLGGLLIDRIPHVTIMGGAIESTGTPLMIASKSEASRGCIGGTVDGLDMENPGDGNPYIDIGQGWTGSTGFAARGWRFHCTGSASGTTVNEFAVRLKHTTDMKFEAGCTFAQPGTPTSTYELVGNTNLGVQIEPTRGMFNASGSPPWVRENGAMRGDATPMMPFLQHATTAGFPATATVSGTSFSCLLSASQGGSRETLYVDNATSTGILTITGGKQGMKLRLLSTNSNSTLVHGTGANEIRTSTGTNVAMVQEIPYELWHDGVRWTLVT